MQHSTQQKSLLWLCRLCIVCPLPRRLTSTQRKSKSVFFTGKKRPAAMSNRNSSCLTFSNVVNLNPMTVNLFKWNEHVKYVNLKNCHANLPSVMTLANFFWPGYCNTNWTIQFLGRSWQIASADLGRVHRSHMPWQLYKDPKMGHLCVKKGIQRDPNLGWSPIDCPHNSHDMICLGCQK